MIHIIYIDTDSELPALKKEFRKCLMTGGAVVRVKAGMAKEDLLKIKETFIADVEPNNLASMVVDEVESALKSLGSL